MGDKVGELLIEPSLKRESELVLKWPSKEELTEGAEFLYLSHKGEFSNDLLDKFFVPEDEMIEQIERSYWSIVYMLKKMSEISPAHLPLPVNVLPDWTDEPMDEVTTIANFSGKEFDSPVSSIEIRVFMLPVVMKVLESAGKEQDFYLDYIIDTFDGVGDAMKEYHNSLTQDMAAYYFSIATQEWSHCLYFDDAFNKDNLRKKVNVLMNASNRMMFARGHLQSDEYMKEYLQLDPEKRGRLWELSFLRKVFPESSRLVELEKESSEIN